MKTVKKKLRLKRKYRIFNGIIIFMVCLILMCLSGFGLYDYFEQSHKTNKEITDLSKTPINTIDDNEETEIIDNDYDYDNPYWDYIKMDLINVDFKDLLNKNPDTVGWVQVKNTNINYPFVQTTDNDYYLNHSFNKKKNSAGWVFLDYRNNISELDRNSIIYAHGRLDKTMFGSLKNILSSEWINNTNNYVIKTSTENENSLWQVFSVYKIPTTSDYLRTKFSDDDDFSEFANMLLNRSQHNFNTTINGNDKIITLSTCYSDTERVVLHAKLIKRQKK